MDGGLSLEMVGYRGTDDVPSMYTADFWPPRTEVGPATYVPVAPPYPGHAWTWPTANFGSPGLGAEQVLSETQRSFLSRRRGKAIAIWGAATFLGALAGAWAVSRMVDFRLPVAKSAMLFAVVGGPVMWGAGMLLSALALKTESP